MLAARGAHSSSGISPADLTSDRRWTRVAIAACLAVVVISRLGFLSSPFQNDAGIYVYMGKTLVDGGRLYHDFYETKFPTVALMMAPLYAVFGATWAYYVVLQLALAIAAAFVMARSARRNISPEAYLPTLLGSLVLLNCSRVVLTGFQLETLQAIFAMAAAAAMLGA